jgi:chromosome segregation ATPase
MPPKVRITLRTVHNNVQDILRKMERLQTATQDGFTAIEGTVNLISALVARIPEIEPRLSNLETEMKGVRVRLDSLEDLYHHLDKKLEVLDNEYVAMSANLKRLEERFDKFEADQLRDRIRVLEEKVSALEKSIVH